MKSILSRSGIGSAPTADDGCRDRCKMSPCFENRNESVGKKEREMRKGTRAEREGKVEIISAFKRAMRSEEDTGMQ